MAAASQVGLIKSETKVHSKIKRPVARMRKQSMSQISFYFLHNVSDENVFDSLQI